MEYSDGSIKFKTMNILGGNPYRDGYAFCRLHAP